MIKYSPYEIKRRNSQIENAQYRNKSHNYVPPTKDPHADNKNINNTLLNAHYAKLRREQ